MMLLTTGSTCSKSLDRDGKGAFITPSTAWRQEVCVMEKLPRPKS
jgi:hypothetical protein